MNSIDSRDAGQAWPGDHRATERRSLACSPVSQRRAAASRCRAQGM